MVYEIYPWEIKYLDFGGNIASCRFFLENPSINNDVISRISEMFAPIVGGKCIEVTGAKTTNFETTSEFLDKTPYYAKWDITVYGTLLETNYHIYIPTAKINLLENNMSTLDLNKYGSKNPFTGYDMTIFDIIEESFRSPYGENVEVLKCELIMSGSKTLPQTNPIVIERNTQQKEVTYTQNGVFKLTPDPGYTISEATVIVETDNKTDITDIEYDYIKYVVKDTAGGSFKTTYTSITVTIPMDGGLITIYRDGENSRLSCGYSTIGTERTVAGTEGTPISYCVVSAGMIVEHDFTAFSEGYPLFEMNFPNTGAVFTSSFLLLYKASFTFKGLSWFGASSSSGGGGGAHSGGALN